MQVPVWAQEAENHSTTQLLTSDKALVAKATMNPALSDAAIDLGCWGASHDTQSTAPLEVFIFYIFTVVFEVSHREFRQKTNNHETG